MTRWTKEQHQEWKQREAVREAAQQNANAAGGDGGLREGNGSLSAAAAPKVSKYRNRKTDGYDSAKEAKRGAELALLERSGQIRDLRRQVRFELVGKQAGERAVHYVADFAYTDTRTGGYSVEDCKGCKTKDFVIKRKLMLERYGIRVRET